MSRCRKYRSIPPPRPLPDRSFPEVRIGQAAPMLYRRSRDTSGSMGGDSLLCRSRVCATLHGVGQALPLGLTDGGPRGRKFQLHLRKGVGGARIAHQGSMNCAPRRLKTSRQPFVPAVPNIIAERDGSKMRAPHPAKIRSCRKTGACAGCHSRPSIGIRLLLVLL